MKFFLRCLLFLNSISGFAQSIRGQITDAETGKPLAHVSLTLLHTPLVTVSDRAGNFAFALPKPVQPGSYVLRASSIGYDVMEQALEVTGSERPALQISLKPALIQLNTAVIVTARRTESLQFDSPEAISVLMPTALLQNAPRSVPEALMGVTGVWMQKTNHGGGSPFLRGLTGQQTLMLVDGIRLNNATFRSGPNQYLNLIDPQSVEQVEVVRGAGSVQYGSDALGGVVQAVTRTPRFSGSGSRLTGSAYAKYMSADMEKSGRAEIGWSSEKVAVLSGLAYRDFGDLKAGGNIGFQRPTGYAQLSGDGKVRFRLKSNQLLTLAYQAVDQRNVPLYHKVQLENFAYNQFQPQQRQLAYARWEAFYENKWARHVQVTGLFQHWKEGRQSQKNGSPTRVEERDDVNTWGTMLVVHSEPTQQWTFHSGFEYYYDRVNSTRQDVDVITRATTAKRGLYSDGATAANLALYTLHTFRINQLTLAMGGRLNAFRISVNENTLGQSTIKPSALVGNFSALYAVLPNHHLMASINTAFRAPNVDDLGTLGIVDFRYEVPNGSLKPEQSFNAELGWKVKAGHFASALSLYRNQLTDIITRVRQGADSIQGYAVYLKKNLGRAYIQGIEADAEWQVATSVATYGNLTYTYGQNQTDNEPFRRIPPLHGLLGVRYQPSRGFWARAELMASTKQGRLAKGDQDDNRIPKGGTPGWATVNLFAGYRTNDWMIGAELQNVCNQAYRTHGSGVNGYGRSVWISARGWF